MHVSFVPIKAAKGWYRPPDAWVRRDRQRQKYSAPHPFHLQRAVNSTNAISAGRWQRALKPEFRDLHKRVRECSVVHMGKIVGHCTVFVAYLRQKQKQKNERGSRCYCVVLISHGKVVSKMIRQRRDDRLRKR